MITIINTHRLLEGLGENFGDILKIVINLKTVLWKGWISHHAESTYHHRTVRYAHSAPEVCSVPSIGEKKTRSQKQAWHVWCTLRGVSPCPCAYIDTCLKTSKKKFEHAYPNYQLTVNRGQASGVHTSILPRLPNLPKGALMHYKIETLVGVVVLLVFPGTVKLVCRAYIDGRTLGDERNRVWGGVFSELCSDEG